MVCRKPSTEPMLIYCPSWITKNKLRDKFQWNFNHTFFWKHVFEIVVCWTSSISLWSLHCDVTYVSGMASQITTNLIVFFNDLSMPTTKETPSSELMVLCGGNPPVTDGVIPLHKGPVIRKAFPEHDFIMIHKRSTLLGAIPRRQVGHIVNANRLPNSLA